MERKSISLTSLDYFSIKEDLKRFLKTQEHFKDYDFEGSSLDILISLLSYNSQNQAYLANMLANESFMDSALLRKNIVSHAKLLGYVPRSVSASVAVVNVAIEDNNNPNATLLLPRGTKFASTNNGVTYSFVTLEDYNLEQNKTKGVFEAKNILVSEGSLSQFAWEVKSGARFILPSKDIDITTLKVVVFPDVSSTNFTVYTRAEEFAEIRPESKVFWVYEAEGGAYELKFGDNVFGTSPVVGNYVYVEYLKTSGPEANGVTSFNLQGTFSGYSKSQITLETVSKSSGGALPEKSTSIKYDAPRSFAAQNRAIGDADYQSITKSIFPSSKAVKVWGGEEQTPPKYGKVFVSIITQDERLLTAGEKNRVERLLKKKCPFGISPKVIDPNFIYVRARLYIKVRREFAESMSSLSSYIQTKAYEYLESSTGLFDSDLYYSRFVQYLNELSSSIYASNVKFVLSMKNSPYLAKNAIYNSDFQNAIGVGTLKSNKFTLVGDSTVYSLTDLGGQVWMTRVSDGVQTESVGNVDYKTGRISVTLKLASVVGDSLELFITPTELDINAEYNNALVVNYENVMVELEAV